MLKTPNRTEPLSWNSASSPLCMCDSVLARVHQYESGLSFKVSMQIIIGSYIGRKFLQCLLVNVSLFPTPVQQLCAFVVIKTYITNTQPHEFLQ